MARKTVTAPKDTKFIEEVIINDREKMPVRGGYMIRTQLMSDEIPDDTFMDQFVARYQREVEDYTNKFPTSTKTEMIQSWRARIVKMHEMIKKTRNDNSLNDFEKKAKIERCLDIIRNDQYSIKQALEYLQRRANEGREMFEKLNQKTK